MTVDFFHNQIIKDTISNKFVESFNENLVPTLLCEYGSALEEIVFYEDHLKTGLRKNGDFFYPLTLVVDGKPFTKWIKWQVANYRSYENMNPYTYKGKKLLEFEVVDEIDEDIADKIKPGPIYSPSDSLPIVLASASEDKTFLAGKYSQAFVDLLARQITDRIAEEFDVSVLIDGGVVLELYFAPGTFMEHIVDNVTYRRILIKAPGCNPRDLWIKWERLDGEGVYTFSDVVTEADIFFDLAEDVSGRIKEKEYRFYTAESVEKYQSSMTRKNITEWRDVMRRVIRRAEEENAPELEDVEVKVIGEEPVAEPETEEPVTEPEIEVEVEIEAEDAPESEDEPEAEEETETEEAEDEPELEAEDDVDELVAEEAEETEETEETEEVDLARALLMQLDAEALDADEDETEAEEEIEDKEEESDEFGDMDPELRALLMSARGTAQEAEEKGGAEVLDREIASEREEAEAEAKREEEEKARIEAEAKALEETEAKKVEDARELEERIRRELEVKIREELEIEMKLKNDEAEALRRELEAKERVEEREKDLMRQQALALIQKQKRIAAQEAEEEKERAEEAARLAEEERRREEEERIAREREAEAARIKEEEERARKEREEQLRREQEERARIEAEEKARAEAELRGNAVYVSKTVRLFFKDSVDSGITKRIHEIILGTIKYFHKEDVYIKIKASIPEPSTVVLNFVEIPEEEMQLLVNIVKVLGRSDLGIYKATLD